jgi:hypothetical protein
LIELAAIKAHTISKWTYPKEDELLQLKYIKMGFKRNRPPNASRKGALPLHTLQKYLHLVELSKKTTFNKLLITAVLSVAFRGMLRVGEYTTRKGESVEKNSRTPEFGT